MGYLHEEGKTRDVFDEEGWLHSGDIGSVDHRMIIICCSVGMNLFYFLIILSL